MLNPVLIKQFQNVCAKVIELEIRTPFERAAVTAKMVA